MKYLILFLLVAGGCKSKHETDSFLVMETLQRRGLIYWYSNDQREQLRSEIEHILKD